MDAILVTWQSGGASLPAIGLGRLLAGAGHGVRVLAPAVYGDRVRRAGCRHVAFPAAAEFDPDRGRAMEDQRAYLAELFSGGILADALADALDGEPADVAVVDYLLRPVVERAAQLVPAHALLVHTLFRFHGPEPVSGAPLVLVPIPRAIDDWPDPPPSVVHTGPIADQPVTAGFTPPWPDDDRRPLVVVTLGTTYMHQEALVGRIARSAAGLGLRVLVLTGLELAPPELEGLPGVHVAGYVPHDAVLPGASLVVCHAGVGTLIAAFAHGVPVVCVPLGRDQAPNAERVVELGAGIALGSDADEPEIAAVIGRAVASGTLRAAATRLAPAMHGDARRAVVAIEELHAGLR